MITVGLKIITHLLIVEEGKQSEDNIVIVSTPSTTSTVSATNQLYNALYVRQGVTLM